MFGKWEILTVFALSLSNVVGLIYPLENELLYEQFALVPALPRPMTTKEDSPFKLFAQDTSQVKVEIWVDDESAGKSLMKNIFLVSFSAETEMELQDSFINGYRFTEISHIQGRLSLCDAILPPDFTQMSPGIKSLTRVKLAGVPKSGTKNMYGAHIRVFDSGYQYAFLINCNDESSITIKKGSFSFKNPHGFLPGGWYIKLPFSLFLMTSYLGVLFIYFIRCAIFKTEVMYVQYGIILVLVMGFIEQSANYFTYLYMNSAGDLPCCPVRTDMGLCLVLSAAKRACFVTFLLAISLGYGIQKPTLSKKEYLAVAIVGFLYLFAAVNYEISVISEIDSMSEGQPVPFTTVVSSMLLSILNVVAVCWIYGSVVRVVDELERDKQTEKKALYEKMSRALIMWFVVGFITEILFYAWITDSVSTPWKYDMVPVFVWDLLFFMVIVQLGWLWLPSSRSSQYAYAQQIPTEDLDEFDPIGTDDDYDDGFSNKGLELNKINHDADAFADDSEDEQELTLN